MRCTPVTPTSAANTKKRSSAIRSNTQRLNDRIHAMYVDKLDGLLDAAFFDKVSSQWREDL